MNAAIQLEIRNFLEAALNFTVSTLQFTAVAGGSINDTYKLTVDNKQEFFCKINSSTSFPGLFETEKKSLDLLARNGSIRVPKVLGVLDSGGKQILLMEWIEQGTRSESFWKKFGRQLAQLHSETATVFGLSENNYMGALPQLNESKPNWIDFFIENRLQPQVQLGLRSGLLTTNDAAGFEKLYKRLNSIFPASKPALVHGDLWSGNFLCDSNSEPVLIDPACYYGIPAVDLAMTTLFGGFERSFYNAYNESNPFGDNHPEQWEICNLYPLLIHLNLFGSSYHGSISRVINRF